MLWKDSKQKQKSCWKPRSASGFLKSRQQTKSRRLLSNVCGCQKEI